MPSSPDREWLPAVLSAVEEAIIGTTIGGIVVAWSNSSERLLGYASHETIGHPRSLLTVPGEEGDIATLIAETDSHQITAPRTVAWRRKGGSVLQLPIVRFPVRNTLGETQGILEVLGAVRAMPTQNRSTDEEPLDRAQLIALRQTVAAFAHEVSQPMTAITNYLQACVRLLNRDPLSDPARAEAAILKALTEVSRAGELVRALRLSTLYDPPAQ